MLLSIAAVPEVAKGQEEDPGRNEFTLSAGFASSYTLQGAKALMPGPASEEYQKSDVKSTLAYFVTYQRALTSRFILGFTIGTSGERGRLTEQTGTRGAEYQWRHYAFAVEARLIYWSRGMIRIYGMAGAGPGVYRQLTNRVQTVNGVGVLTESSEEIRLGPGYQFTPAGIRIGSRFGGFAELGIGYKGVVNLGASFRF
jgi:hypothetical protein